MRLYSTLSIVLMFLFPYIVSRLTSNILLDFFGAAKFYSFNTFYFHLYPSAFLLELGISNG